MTAILGEYIQQCPIKTQINKQHILFWKSNALLFNFCFQQKRLSLQNKWAILAFKGFCALGRKMCAILSIMLSAFLETSVYLMFRDAEHWDFVDILYADLQVRLADLILMVIYWIWQKVVLLRKRLHINITIKIGCWQQQ